MRVFGCSLLSFAPNKFVDVSFKYSHNNLLLCKSPIIFILSLKQIGKELNVRAWSTTKNKQINEEQSEEGQQVERLWVAEPSLTWNHSGFSPSASLRCSSGTAPRNSVKHTAAATLAAAVATAADEKQMLGFRSTSGKLLTGWGAPGWNVALSPSTGSILPIKSPSRTSTRPHCLHN